MIKKIDTIYNPITIIIVLPIVSLSCLTIFSCKGVQNNIENSANKIGTSENIHIIPTGYPLSLFFTDVDTGWVLYTKSLWKTTDRGESWKPQLTVSKELGFSDDEDFIGLRVLNNNDLYSFTYSSIFKTTDSGEKWTRILNLDFRKSIADIYINHSNQSWVIGSELINSLEKPLLLYSNDGGNTWSEDKRLLLDENQKQYDSGLHSIYFINDKNAWISSVGKMWISKDGGRSWNKLHLEINNEDAYRIVSMQFFDSREGYAHLAASKGAIPNELVKTTDGGESWHIITPKPSLSKLGINDFHFLNKLHGFVLLQNSIYETVNGGKDWVPINIKDDIDAQEVFFLDEENGWIAGRDGKLIVTNDTGKTWYYRSIK